MGEVTFKPAHLNVVQPPAGAFGQRLRFAIQRFPLLHKPLWWLKRKVVPRIWLALCDVLRRLVPGSVWFGPPRGCFSEYSLLTQNAPSIRGRVILTDQGMPKLPTPSIMLLCKRKQHLEQPWPIFWSHRKNTRLIGPGLAHLNEQKQLCIEAGYGPQRSRSDPAYVYLSARPAVRLSGNWTSIVSRWGSIAERQPYAHWLLDALPRLGVIHEFPPGTGIIVPPQRPEYQVQSLRLLGLLDHCRWTREPHLLVENYYFSSPTSMIVCYNPYAVNFLRSRFLSLADRGANTPARFFLKRGTYGRNMTNAAEVFSFFEAAGWTIVDTAGTAFEEQVQLFAGADAVCGIHGSGMANIVWCKRGCKVLELFADTYLAGDQEWIAQCVDADYRFMTFPADHKLNATIDLARVRSELRSWGLL